MNVLHRLHLCPLLPVAILWMAGLALGHALPPGPAFLLPTAFLSLVAWGLCERTLPARWRAAGASLALAGCILTAGAALWTLNQHHAPAAHLARLLTEEPALLSARVQVAAEPSFRPRAAERPAFLGPGNTSLAVEVTRVLTDRGWIDATGTALLTIRGELPLRRGQTLEVCGWAQRPHGPRNPGEFDYARYLAAARVFATITVTRPEQVRVRDQATSVSWLEQFRRFIHGKLIAHTVPEDPEAGYTLAALLLGHRDASIERIGQAFSDAGAAHLLAISGAHVVLVAAAVWWLLRWILPRPRWHTALTLIIVLLYVAATPCGPPILRAAIGATLFTLARWSSRRASALNLLSVAVILVLLVRPGDLLDAGFQLSFACTAGLILLATRVRQGLFGGWLQHRGRIARAIGTPAARRFQRLRHWLAEALSLNLVGAGVAAPLVWYHFAQCNALAVLTGLLLLPLVMLTMAAGGTQLAAEALGLGELLAPATAGIAGLLIRAVEFCAHLPGAMIALRPPPVCIVFLLCAVLVLWAARPLLTLQRSTLVVCGVLALALAGVWSAATQDTRPRLTVLAGGQCAVLQTRSGRAVLLNVGGPTHFAQRTVDPFLRTRGIARLHSVVLVLTDREHAAEVIPLVDRYRPAAVLCGSLDVQRQRTTYAAGELAARLARRSLTLTPLSAGTRVQLDRDALLEVLWPPDAPLPGLSGNRCGLVLRLTLAGRRVLLLSGQNDIGLAAAQVDPPIDALILTGARPAKPEVASLAAQLAPRRIIGRLPLADETPRPLAHGVDLLFD